MKLVELHSHSLLSDGVLLPSELVRRYEVAGFSAISITDHADSSNLDSIVESLVRVCVELNKYWKIRAIPGVELTHLPLEQFKPLVLRARKKGAKIVVGHGESPVEPVIKGTNRAAIEAKVDLLAHPGKITKGDAALAAKKDVLLEVTMRKGHSNANKHVAKIAALTGAKLAFGTDAHSPEDIPSESLINANARKASLTDTQIKNAFKDSKKLISRIIALT